jgi:methylase of polypeptide subunit release factors
LKPEGLLALEIGNNQSEQVKELFSKEKVYENITIVPDLRGIKRVVTAILFSYL